VFELVTGSESFASFSFINFLLWKEGFRRDESFSADVFALCCPPCPSVADGPVTSGSLWELGAGVVETGEEEVAQAASGPHRLTRAHMTSRC